VAISIANIKKHLTHGELYAFCDVPADGVALALTGGVPNGARTLYLGATQNESVGIYNPTIEGVDVEQLMGQIGYHLVSEVTSIRATLAEPNLRNLELVASQGTRVNLLDNASFEGAAVGGLATGWQAVGAITSPSVTAAGVQPAYGKQAQVFTTAAATGGIQTPKFSHPRLVAGAIVVLSAYAKAAAATPNLQLKLEAFDAAGASLGSNTALQALSTAYARGSVAYTLPANTATVQATLQDATGQSATWTLDNAQLEIVASGSAPTALVGPAALFLGGKQDVPTMCVALVGVQPTAPTKYSWFVLYDAYVTGGLNIRKNRGQATTFPVEFTGIPVPSRTAGDTYGQWGADQ
jgi:hypothetical protein